MNEMNEKKFLIMSYTTKEECMFLSDTTLFDCKHCNNIEECFENANCKCNDEFAEIVCYGGYNTKEEYWEQLFN